MNDDILIAEQEECDVALVDGTKVFRYKDGDGNIQTVDMASVTDGTSLFENNQNIGVDWEVDLPTLTNATNMFKGSNIKSFAAKLPSNTNSSYMFDGCENLEYISMDIPILEQSKPIKTYYVKLVESFNGCTSLKKVKLKKPDDLSLAAPTYFGGSSLFADCTNLESVDIDFRVVKGALVTTFTDMFKNCKSLKSVNLNLSMVNRMSSPQCTGMFSGCLLGPEQLQQILYWKWPSTMYASRSPITIGVDSTKVSQEDIDNYWNIEIGYKGFTITWELNTPE